MKKWFAIGIGGVVVMGVLLLAAGETPRPVSLATTVPAQLQQTLSPADIRIANMHLMAQHGAEPGWRVSARQATFFEDEQVATVRRLQAQLFRDGDVIRLTAARGLLRSDTGDMTVAGQVSLAHQPGLVIETDILRWQASNRLLSTDAPVVLRSPSVVVTGTGLRSRVDQQRLTIPHKVRASFRWPEPR